MSSCKALVAFLLLLPAFAVAQEPPAIDPAFCQALVKHVPEADVAYQPGIDAYGRPVAPADIEGSPRLDLPDELVWPVTADAFRFLNLNQSQFPFNSMARNDIYVGTLSLRGGTVFWNGQPITDAEQDNLAVLCLKPSP